MTSNQLVYIFILSLLGTFYSCGSVNAPMGAKPKALGKLNEIVVIADKDLWEGAIGDTFKYYFGAAYPIMPTPEPMFDLRHYTPIELSHKPLRKELRTYIILANLEDENSSTRGIISQDLGKEKFNEALEGNGFSTSVGKNKWAEGQILFYLFGMGHDQVSKTIRNSYSTIANRVNEHDKRQLRSMTYGGSSLTSFDQKLEDSYGIKLGMPDNYKIAKEADSLLWLRKDDGEFVYNLVFDKIKYTDQKELSKKSIKDWIEVFGSEHVDSSTEGDVMVINDEDLPVFEYSKNIDEAYTTEIRGVWEMTEDYLGGPFFGYALLNEKANEVIYIYAFVRAVGKPKRDRMQQLSFLVESIEWL